MREAERLIRPLEEVFNRLDIKNLSSQGVIGVIPVEVSTEDLISIAKSEGYEVEGYGADELNLDTGGFWIYPEDKSEMIGFYTKSTTHGEVAYVLDDEFEAFKELFLRGVAK